MNAPKRRRRLSRADRDALWVAPWPREELREEPADRLLQIWSNAEQEARNWSMATTEDLVAAHAALLRLSVGGALAQQITRNQLADAFTALRRGAELRSVARAMDLTPLEVV